MKRLPKSPELLPLLAVGAHPDDIEFACGGVIAKEKRAGRAGHFVVCSAGESGSLGTPAQRKKEAQKAADILGATLEFVDFDGDGHLEARVNHAIRLAGIIRRVKPGILLGPSLVANQHPDHSRLGRLVCDAARLARYGGLRELKPAEPHAIDQLLFYAVTPGAEPEDATAILVDVSDRVVQSAWVAAMGAHASQLSGSRDYVKLQLTRARLRGLEAGVEMAIALFSPDPLVVDSLSRISRSARRF